MEGPFYYTYITTNLTRKEKGLVPYLYIGQHCTYDINDGYIGSQSLLQKHKKEGDNFIREICAFYDDIYQLGNAEYDLIKEKNAIKDKKFYNRGNQRYYNKNFIMGLPNSVKKYLSSLYKGKSLIEIYGPEKAKKIHDNIKKNSGLKKGTKFSTEHRKNIGLAGKGRKPWNAGIKNNQIWITNGQKSKMINLSLLEDYLKNGWRKGRGKVVATKKWLSNKKTCEYCAKEFHVCHYARYHGPKCKLKPI